MEGSQIYHAIKVNTNLCFGCTHCMKVCPTEAIRIKDGKAAISPERCVDCGNCLRACPVNAFYVEHDDPALIGKYTFRVLLFPSVMIGQFPDRYSDDQIYQAMLDLGFTHAFEVEQPIGILMESLKEIFGKNRKRPLISSFCPAIVRLIQCKYPALVDHIVPLKAPHDLVAHFVIEKLKKSGAREHEIGIFYVSPCSAKKAAVNQPVGEKSSIVNGTINMNDLFNQVMKVISSREKTETSQYRAGLTKEGILWSLPRGEAKFLRKRAMAIDGIHHVVKFLERLENEDVPQLDFLELKSCSKGCAGGILLSGNRFLTVERLQKRAANYPKASHDDIPYPEKEYLKSKLCADRIIPRNVFALHPDRATALYKMETAAKILCQLPGIDCGACGAPNCHALAEDMVQGKARMTDCVFLQKKYVQQNKITTHKVQKNLEKIWGKNRFDADCNKKGGRNEGF